MKSQQKRTPAKKPRQRKVDKDDNTIVLDLGAAGSAEPAYDFSFAGGADTISIDPSWTTSITIPSGAYIGSGATVGYNGGYTISTGTSTVSNWSSYNYDPSVNITSDGITMKEGSDIKVGGKSLTEAIEKIEERLGILQPNPELEDRWEQLKALRKQYQDLEKELLEKEKMWKILKEK